LHIESEPVCLAGVKASRQTPWASERTTTIGPAHAERCHHEDRSGGRWGDRPTDSCANRSDARGNACAHVAGEWDRANVAARPAAISPANLQVHVTFIEQLGQGLRGSVAPEMAALHSPSRSACLLTKRPQAAVESIKRMLSKLHFSVGQPPTVLRLLKDQVICEDRLFVT